MQSFNQSYIGGRRVLTQGEKDKLKDLINGDPPAPYTRLTGCIKALLLESRVAQPDRPNTNICLTDQVRLNVECFHDAAQELLEQTCFVCGCKGHD